MSDGREERQEREMRIEQEKREDRKDRVDEDVDQWSQNGSTPRECDGYQAA